MLPAYSDNPDDYNSVYQNFEIEAKNCDELVEYLYKNGIHTSLPWGGKGVHQFARLGISSCTLPQTEEMFKKALMLPLYPELTDVQIKYVCQKIMGFYSV